MTRLDRPEGRSAGVGTPGQVTARWRFDGSPTAAALVALADEALALGRPAVNPELGVFAAPDITIIEGGANGHPTPPSSRLVRDDGRVVHFFALPAGWSR